MSWLRRRWLPLTVLVAATAALLASIVWAAAGTTRWPAGGMMGPAVSGHGPVRDLAGAKGAAQRFADRWGLHVGEVMQFSDNFYAELLDPAGNRATEVLVDPGSGAVGIEPGPAMMWNTSYAMMHPAVSGAATVTSEQARQIADRWLQRNKPGLQAGEAEPFPGYYTLHTLRGDQIVGMLSVHAASGAVWYHTWHGRFIGMQE